MKRKRFLPPWLFITAVVTFDELMLHLWTNRGLAPLRLITVLIFALAFGSLLGSIVSFFSRPQWAKWAATLAGAILAVVYFAMYLICDAYQNFMTPATIVSGAGGVASDYLSIALTTIFRNLWRLAVLAAPVICYGIFVPGMAVHGGFRAILAGICIVFYLLGFGSVQLFGMDAARLGSTYDFDSAVRAFGLHMGIALETLHSFSGSDAAPDFLPTEPLTTEAPTDAPTEAPTEPTEPPVVYAPHVLGLDFAALAEAETDPGIQSLHSYIASQTPAMENEYTGLFAGKNLIFITAEAFSRQIIDPELTPTLYRLATQGIRFEEYYQPAWGGSTTSGEFSNLIGIVPVGGGKCMNEAIEQNLFLTIGNQLQSHGYYSTAYHNHSYTYYNRDETHTRLGYDFFVGMGNGMEVGVRENVPESDLEMMEFTVPKYIDQQPFSIYYMTMSGHALYSRGGNAMSRKNYERTSALPYPETVKCYFAANMELEDAMTYLVAQLEATGTADDTVIVLAPDHYPYALEKSSAWGNSRNYLQDLYGTDEIDCFVRDRSTLIIWSGSLEGQGITVSDPVYSLDILPTLSNLFGVPYDSRLLVGRDVFSDTHPLVLWPDHSWVTDLGSYNAATGRFTPAKGVQPADSYLENISAIVANKITYSKGVQSRNYFNVLAQLLN